MNIEIAPLNRSEMIDILLEFAAGERARTVFYLNAHCVNISFLDFEYRQILGNADLVYADGQGVVWAGRFLGAPLAERVNIFDFFDELAKRLKEKEITIYLLGGREGIVKKAEDFLTQKGLKVLGGRAGFFDKAQEAEIIGEINILKPDILMVGMGAPKQEKWIHSHLNELDVSLCWAVGGAFNYFAGRFKKSPRWVSACGFEWLYSGLQDPGKLFNRYLFGNLIFIYHVLKYKFIKKKRR